MVFRGLLRVATTPREASYLGIAFFMILLGHTPSPAIVNQPPRPHVGFTTSFIPSATTGTERSNEERQLRTIPDYVLDHAPYVHLFSQERYWPGDIAEHLYHTTPYVNYTALKDHWQHLDIANLSALNEFLPWSYLQSLDDPELEPEWLDGKQNIPPGSTRSHTIRDDPTAQPDEKGSERSEASHSKTTDSQSGITAEGRSNAPAFLFAVDKGNDTVDAFWFFFYHYNLGNAILRTRFGNHIGDWEHTAVRFVKGEPKLVFFSEHEWGNAYTWEATEKMGKRMVAYSASGTHAMYGSAGYQKYMLPFGLLYDRTDKGPLWDPTLNMHAYTYDVENDILRSSTLTPDSPTSWFHYGGRWGDKRYAPEDRRQYHFVGQYRYVDGPQGPKFKNLGRRAICQIGDPEHCTIVDKLE